MKSDYKKPRNKPKGWRLIVVDGVEYYWAGGSYLSEARNVETWKKFSINGWYRQTEEGKQYCNYSSSDSPLTPAIVAKSIKWYVSTQGK